MNKPKNEVILKIKEMGIPIECPSCSRPLKFSNLLSDEVFFICPGMCGYRRVLSKDEQDQIRGASHTTRSYSLRTLLSGHNEMYNRIRRLADSRNTTMENIAFRLLELGIEKVDTMPSLKQQEKLDNIERYTTHVRNGLTIKEIAHAEGVNYNAAVQNLHRYGVSDKVKHEPTRTKVIK